ncbi:hypothetical protein MMC07_006136 [Pseudocyphellaria aurata]|nr:hypothetical protein [Pseudocyphellaria aurata]
MVNNWIYIDGGDIAYQAGAYDRVNTTSAIDLSKDWTNSTLELVQSPRPADAVALASSALWFDQERNSIYCFGGGKSFATHALSILQAPLDSIWGFKLNDEGTAAWYQVMGPVSTTPFPTGMHRIASGASTSDSNRAYYLGGFYSDMTSPSTSSNQTPASGLLTFDFDTLNFTNSSDGGYLAPHFGDRWPTGRMFSISRYGDDGILVVIPSGRDSLDYAFNNITVYDKKNQAWYSQIASGDIPQPRSYFCAVGVEGNNSNTFEIFLHGGKIKNEEGSQASNSDQIYVLSLPSFQWFLASDASAYSRAAHRCHISNNQMIMIGGINPSHWNENDLDAPAEPWLQAIGVFDLGSWRYKDSYQANANAYETPEIVTKYYSASGSPYPSSWTSAGVKALFESKAQNTTNTTAPDPPSPPSAATTPPQPHRLGHGAVAGIAVGCTAFIVTCAVCAIFTMRHRSKKRKLTELSSSSPTLSPSGSQRTAVELSAFQRPQELLTENKDRAEVPHTDEKFLHELSTGTTTCPELVG